MPAISREVSAHCDYDSNFCILIFFEGMASLAKSLIRLTISTLAIMVLYTIYHQRYWGIVQFTKTDPFDPVGTLPALASQRHSNSLNLNEHECSNVFPRLTKYIQDSIQRGPFKLNRSDDDYQGLVQGRIKDGKVTYSSTGSRIES